MTTESTESAPSETGSQPDPTQANQGASATDAELGDAGKAAIQAERDARKASDRRAKVLEAELAKVREATMSENEKALSEAENRGRTSAAKDFGVRLAATQFDALAGRRNADFDTAAILDDLNLAKYVDEDGTVKETELKKAVDRLVPEPTNGPPSFERGHRQTASGTTNMNDLIRQTAGITPQ